MAKRILLVERDPRAVESVASLLATAGFETFIVDNGADAIRSAHDVTPDLLVIGLHLPLVNAASVIGAARFLEPALPIILFAADGDDLQQVVCDSRMLVASSQAEILASVAFFMQAR